MLTLLFEGGIIPDSKNSNVDMTKIVYPYIANQKRADQILKNWMKITTMMSSDEVKKILGAPDEELPLNSAQIKNSKIIGTTYWYLIQRLKENGSVEEKKEILVRINFDLKNRVTSVDHWGLEFLNR